MIRSFLVVCSLIPMILIGQTGPGGVGSRNGSSNLVLWLDANSAIGSHGSTVTSWNDKSGFGNNFTAGSGAVLDKSSVNGYSSFGFNGVTNYFESAFSASMTPDEFTLFTATNVTSNGNYKCVISNRDDPAGTATRGFILYSVPTSNVWEFWTGRLASAWEPINSGISTAGNWNSQMLSYRNVSNGKSLNIGGADRGTATHSMDKNTFRPIRVGAGRNESTPDYFFSGQIGEIIMYNNTLNSAQKIIVNNYLSAKYNYTLSTNDIYDEDLAAAGNFDHDVAGIGRVNASNIHNDAQGTGIVRIQNPTNLGNNEFLLWGHNNGLLQAIITADVPSTVQARMGRVWRASEVNASGTGVNVGAIDISFDLTNLGSVTASDLRLLVDSDNDGFFNDETPISGAASVGGNVYRFSGINAIANNLRFTIGTINVTQTPLPIELVDFTATPINNEIVQLDWQTASEMNNDYFTVERSTDGNFWTPMSRVDGAGNSTELLNYSINDENPLVGLSYYRLKQTDFNGDFIYSKIRAVQINRIDSTDDLVFIYPNPTQGLVEIKAPETELEVIRIYNSMGQELSNFVTVSSIKSDVKTIDLTNLAKGIYTIQFKSTTKKVIKE